MKDECQGTPRRLEIVLTKSNMASSEKRPNGLNTMSYYREEEEEEKDSGLLKPKIAAGLGDTFFVHVKNFHIILLLGD